MACPHCEHPKTNPRAKKTKLGYPTFYCPACRRTFNERTGSRFNHYFYPTDIIFLVVLWRRRYKLSLRDLVEMFLVWGIEPRNGAVMGSRVCPTHYPKAQS